jgi:hypothetical protein
MKDAGRRPEEKTGKVRQKRKKGDELTAVARPMKMKRRKTLLIENGRC